MNCFLKSSVRFFVVLFMSVAMSASTVFALITGEQTSEDYTFSSNNTSDTISSYGMMVDGYWSSEFYLVVLNTNTATSLTVQGTGTQPTMSSWNNNMALNLPTSGSLIYLNNIRVNNNSSLQADSLIVDGSSYLFSDSGSLNFDTITNNGYINASATNITATSGMQSNGTLVLYGGTNNNTITGTGQLYVMFNDFTNNADITQDYIYIYDDLDVVNVSGSSITAKGLTIQPGSTFTTDIDDIDTYTADGYINNNGLLNITADGTNYNRIGGSATGNLNIGFGSTVYNDGTATISQSTITVSGVFVNDNSTDDAVSASKGFFVNANATLESNASALAGDITNNGGWVVFTGGTNDNDVTGTGWLRATNTMTNNGDITQGRVYIDGGTVTNNGVITADDIYIDWDAILLTTNLLDTTASDGGIHNNGLLQVNVSSMATVNNGNIIDGSGNFQLLGNTIFTQQTGRTITQNAILVSSNASMTANPEDLILTDKIYNDGSLTLTGFAKINDNEITGTGDLFIDGLIQNRKNINQANLTMYDSTSLWNIEGATITLTDNLLIGSSADLGNNGILNIVNGVNNGSITYGTTSEGIINITGDFINNGNMAQEELYISSGASVITNAYNSNMHKFISNDGDFIFTGGLSDDKIIGTGTLTYNGAEGDLTNTADIDQFAVNITTGTFYNSTGAEINATNVNIDEAGILNADIDDIDTYSAEGRILNNGLILLNITDTGYNYNSIIGTGTIRIDGLYTLFNNSSIVQGSIVNNWDFVNNETGSVDVVSFDSNRYGQNDGLIDAENFNNDGEFLNTAAGILNAGTFINTNLFANNGTANAEYLVNNGMFFNDNALNIEGGVNFSTITRQSGVGFGTMTVTNGVFDNSGGTIIQYTAIIENGGHLITDADDLILDTGISNNSILEFTGGTIVNPVTGTGTLLITGVVGSSNTINQNHLGVYGSFVNSSHTYVSSAFIDNGGYVRNYAGSNLFIDSLVNNGTINNLALRGSGFEVGNVLNSGAIGGSGDIQIYGTFINESSGTLQQANINIVSETAGLISNASSLTGNINNAGNLVLTSGTNSNVISGFEGNYGDLTINGNVTSVAQITQENLTVSNGSLFDNLYATFNDTIFNNGAITNRGFLSAYRLINNSGAVVTNNSDFGLYEGINNGTITGTGVLSVHGDFTNLGSISQNEVYVTAGLFQNGAQLTASNLDISSAVEFRTNMSDLSATVDNDGMIVTNGGTNTNTITGEGSLLVFGGAMINNGTITQNDLGINSDSTLRTSAQSLTIANGIENNGTLFIDHTISADTNANDIRGTGILRIVNGTDLTNTGEIRQEGIAITNGSTLRTNANLLYIANRILNNGTLNFNVTGDNSNNITGSGTLSITDGAQVVNTGTIGQNLIYIDENSRLITNASLLNGTAEIQNGWDLVFTGGLNTTTITDPYDGILYIEGDVENADGVSITQTGLDINDGNKFIVNAADLDITEGIENNGILEFKDVNDSTLDEDVYGSGALVKTGAGIVELTGENTYSGQTIITEGALQISDESNIGDNVIGFDGGKLIASANSFAINNQLTATQGNNVNIDVIDGHLSLDGVINQQSTTPANLVKDGNGILELEMYDNYYQGDTYVNNGTLIGTTRNIKGKLYGTGSSNLDTYEFTDGIHYSDSVVVSALYPKAPSSYGYDVVLNEVDSTKYLGTFNKTGSASMEVVNYFRAHLANINDGALYVNNIDSGNDFIVDSTMTFTNSLLGGNSNITVTTLVMGEDSTLAPGNSIGTTNITGDLVFASSSTYEVEFEQASMQSGGISNDTTNVSGTTTIDSNNTSLDLINLDGKFYVHETFDIITSSGALTGEFANSSITGFDVDSPDLRLGSRIEYSTATVGNTLQLQVRRIASDYENSTELLDMSHNEKEVARSIDAISTGNGGDITNALDALEQYYYYTSTYDLDALKAGFNDIAGVIYSNAALLPYFNSKIEHVYDKIQPRENAISSCGRFHDKIWGEYYYNNYKVDRDDNSPEYQTYTNGFLVGFDMISSNKWFLGITSGYGESTLNQEHDKTNMKDVNIGLYGGYETDKWQFKSMLFAGWERYNTEREITFMDRTAKSDYQGYSTSLDVEGAYKILLTKNADAKHKLTLKPFAGMFMSYIKQNGFEESGADSLNLKVEDNNIVMAQARLGVGINGKLNRFGWYANVGARQLLTKDYNELYVSLLDYQDDTKMKIKSATLFPFSITGGLGADYILSEDWTIFANGQTNFANRSKEIYANVGLTYKFGCPKKEKQDVVTVVDDELQSKFENEKKVSEGLRKELKQLQKEYDSMKSKIVSAEEAKKIKERKITQVELTSKLQFKFNSTELTEKGKASLQEVIKELQRYPDAELLIEGHCDNLGAPAYNQKLSEGRANAVAESLEKDYGIKNKISVIGKGSTENLVPNDSPANREINRRVEITIVQEEEVVTEIIK